jgi:hypothetical protein
MSQPRGYKMQTLTRKSILSGIETTKTLDVTQQQYDDWKINGALIQHAMPDLSASDREWLMTGIHEVEWSNIFGDKNESV